MAVIKSRRARWILKHRERARKAGLCTTCFKEKPDEGRVICASCNERARLRMAHHRAIRRERTKLQEIILTHERVGDLSQEHHLHEDAAQHYQDALNVHTITEIDRSRISEKLAYALSLGSYPSAANPLLDRVLASYIDKPEKVEKTVQVLLQKARQLWADAKAESALPLLTQAIHIAEVNDSTRLCKLTNGRMAGRLIVLHRYKEAVSFLDAMGKIDSSDDVAIQTTFYASRGIIAAAFGDTKGAFEYFERALAIAKEDPDVVHATGDST